jgi:N-acetylglutamate synthase-like GNAT family acetyltransferase
VSAITIRAATANDQATIKAMIRHEDLDWTSLDWRHFVVAQDDENEDKIVGIGQVKVLPGAHELGSLIVLADYRGQGIAGRIIAALEANAPRPLYLLCEERMTPYYAGHGYRRIKASHVPLIMLIKFSIPTLLYLGRYKFAVMVKDA